MNSHGDMSSTVTSTTTQIMDKNNYTINDNKDNNDVAKYENGILINVEEILSESLKKKNQSLLDCLTEETAQWWLHGHNSDLTEDDRKVIDMGIDSILHGGIMLAVQRSFDTVVSQQKADNNNNTIMSSSNNSNKQETSNNNSSSNNTTTSSHHNTKKKKKRHDQTTSSKSNERRQQPLSRRAGHGDIDDSYGGGVTGVGSYGDYSYHHEYHPSSKQYGDDPSYYRRRYDDYHDHHDYDDRNKRSGDYFDEYSRRRSSRRSSRSYDDHDYRHSSNYDDHADEIRRSSKSGERRRRHQHGSYDRRSRSRSYEDRRSSLTRGGPYDDGDDRIDSRARQRLHHGRSPLSSERKERRDVELKSKVPIDDSLNTDDDDDKCYHRNSEKDRSRGLKERREPSRRHRSLSSERRRERSASRERRGRGRRDRNPKSEDRRRRHEEKKHRYDDDRDRKVGRDYPRSSSLSDSLDRSVGSDKDHVDSPSRRSRDRSRKKGEKRRRDNGEGKGSQDKKKRSRRRSKRDGSRKERDSNDDTRPSHEPHDRNGDTERKASKDRFADGATPF
jgi:hypothetical protein